MLDTSPGPHNRWLSPNNFKQAMPAIINLRYRLGLLRWLVPASLVVLVIVYEIGPARWINDQWGFTYHLLAEIAIFGTIGPVVVFFLIDLLWRWLDEKDTSDFQAHLLSQAREEAKRNRQITDDAIQSLFSAGTLITALRSSQPELSPRTISEIETLEQSLNETILRLRSHLQDQG